jgi:general secretion pathway protein E
MSIEVANSAPPPEALAHLVHVRLGEWLTRAGKLSVRDLDRAIGAQQEMGSMLGRVLVRLGLVSEIDVARALSEQLRVPFVGTRGLPRLGAGDRRPAARVFTCKQRAAAAG